jgi:long-chain-acyl-CoA dehydrogenase
MLQLPQNTKFQNFSNVVDECLQLHGGYGYMLEYPIARAYIDNPANRIYAGTTNYERKIFLYNLCK